MCPGRVRNLSNESHSNRVRGSALIKNSSLKHSTANLVQSIEKMSECDWLLLPDLIFGDIMLMVGLQSLETLHRCRQVCRTWNDKIMTNIWGNSHKKNIIQQKIELQYDQIIYISTRYEYGSVEKDLQEILRLIPSSEDLFHTKWLGKS